MSKVAIEFFQSLKPLVFPLPLYSSTIPRAVASAFPSSNCKSTCNLTSVQVKQVKEMALFLTGSTLSTIVALLSKETGITVLPVCVIYYFFKSTLCTTEKHSPTCFDISSNNNNNNTTTTQNNNNNDHTKEDGCRQPCQLVNSTHIMRDKLVALFLTYGPLIIPLMTMIACVWWRMSMLHGSLPFFSDQDNPSAFADSPITRLLTLWYLAAFNVYLIIFPSNLSYDWQMGSIPLVTKVLDPRNLLSLLVASTNRENVSLLMGLAITVITFLPASNLFVTVGFVVAERILYLPSLGVAMMIVIGWRKLVRSTPSKYHNWFTCIFYMVTVIFAMKTVQRNRVWSNRQSLFESGLVSTPSNAKVHYNYANLQRDLGNGDLAERHYRIALSLWPRHESSLNNLATVLSDRSPHLAEKYFRRVLQINPFHSKAYFNLASIFSKRGLKSKAINLLKTSIYVDSKFAEAYSMLASLCTSLSPRGNKSNREVEDADIFSPTISSFKLLSNVSQDDTGYNDLIVSPACPSDIGKLHLKALQLSPFNSDIINDYGAFLHMTGRRESAVIQYTRALRVNPSHKIARSNLHSLLRSNDAS